MKENETIKETSQGNDPAGRVCLYRWEQCPNEMVCILHVDQMIPNCEKHFDYSKPEFCTDEGKHLAGLLDGVRGIVGFWTGKYEICITKGNVFKWDSIKPRVESIVAEHLSCELKPA